MSGDSQYSPHINLILKRACLPENLEQEVGAMAQAIGERKGKKEGKIRAYSLVFRTTDRS